jgi:arginase family enzyme
MDEANYCENLTTHCFTAGTPEAGGWTIREVKRIIRGLAGLHFV